MFSRTYRVIVIIISFIGLLMILLSGTRNLYFLFSGISLVVLSLFALKFTNKSNPRIYFIFIFLINTVLLIFNVIDFRANYVHIEFFDWANYSPKIFSQTPYFYSFSGLISGNYLISPEYALHSEIPNNTDSKEKIIFEKRPNLIESDFSLIEIFSENEKIEASWYWSGLNTEGKNDSINLNSQLEYIILEKKAHADNISYDVFINDINLTGIKSADGLLYYSTADEVLEIKNIKIVEKERNLPFNIRNMKPLINSLFIIQEEPNLIKINRMHFFKYLPSVNLLLPIFEYVPKENNFEFYINEGDLFIDNLEGVHDDELLQIIPMGLEVSLQPKKPISEIVPMGFTTYYSFQITFFTGITLIFLSGFLGINLIINQQEGLIQRKIQAVRTQIDGVVDRLLNDGDIQGIQPFKITIISFFILICFILLIPRELSLLIFILLGLLIPITLLLINYIFRYLKD